MRRCYRMCIITCYRINTHTSLIFLCYIRNNGVEVIRLEIFFNCPCVVFHYLKDNGAVYIVKQEYLKSPKKSNSYRDIYKEVFKYLPLNAGARLHRRRSPPFYF